MFVRSVNFLDYDMLTKKQLFLRKNQILLEQTGSEMTEQSIKKKFLTEDQVSRDICPV